MHVWIRLAGDVVFLDDVRDVLHAIAIVSFFFDFINSSLEEFIVSFEGVYPTRYASLISKCKHCHSIACRYQVISLYRRQRVFWLRDRQEYVESVGVLRILEFQWLPVTSEHSCMRYQWTCVGKRRRCRWEWQHWKNTQIRCVTRIREQSWRGRRSDHVTFQEWYSHRLLLLPNYSCFLTYRIA